MWLGERYYSGAGAVIALSGVLLVTHGHWSWSGGFIWVGVAVIVIGAAMGVSCTPLAKQRIAALESGDKAAAAAAQARTIVLALVDTALVLTAIVVMVRKWHA